MDFDADVPRTSIHRPDVIFARAIQTLYCSLRGRENEWTELLIENVPPASVGALGEFRTFGNRIGLPLGDCNDVVSFYFISSSSSF